MSAIGLHFFFKPGIKQRGGRDLTLQNVNRCPPCAPQKAIVKLIRRCYQYELESSEEDRKHTEEEEEEEKSSACQQG